MAGYYVPQDNQLNTPTNSVAANNFDIAVNPTDGSYVVVWAEGGEIKFQQFNKDGTAKGPATPTTVGGTAGGDQETDPSITIANDGKFYIAYADPTVANPLIWVNAYNADGTPNAGWVGGRTAVDSVVGANAESKPDIAVTPNGGELVVVWQFLFAAADNNIKVVRLDPNTGALTIGITDIAATVTNETNPQIDLRQIPPGVTPTDVVGVIGWTETVAAGNDDARFKTLLGGNLNLAATYTTAPEGLATLLPKPGNQDGSLAAINSNGDYVIVYNDDLAVGNKDVKYLKFAGGNFTSGTVADGTGNQVAFDVSINTDGSIVVAYTDGDLPNSTVKLQEIAADGSKLRPAQTVDATLLKANPALGITADGNSLVIGGLDGNAANNKLNIQEYQRTVQPRSGHDFNGDGVPDIVLRNIPVDINNPSGAAGTQGYIYLNPDGSIKGFQAILDKSISLETPYVENSKTADEQLFQWSIVDLGDFNNDDKPELLWNALDKNDPTRFNDGVWFLDDDPTLAGEQLTQFNPSETLPGTTIKKATFLTQAGEPNGIASNPNVWDVVGVYDFDGDSQDDVAWYNDYTPTTQPDGSPDPNNGKVSYWKMAGINYTGSAPFIKDTGGTQDAVQTNQNAELVAVDDFNNDKKPDFAWHDPITGQISFWFTDGAKLVATGNLDQSLTDQSFDIIGAADVNIDGNADLVVYSNTQFQVWTLDGNAGGTMDRLDVLTTNLTGISTDWQAVV
jgi:hypothetical protein